MFYKLPCKVQIFGICCDAFPLQHNYIVDEAETIGINGSKSHGPNAGLQVPWPKCCSVSLFGQAWSTRTASALSL